MANLLKVGTPELFMRLTAWAERTTEVNLKTVVDVLPQAGAVTEAPAVSMRLRLISLHANHKLRTLRAREATLIEVTKKGSPSGSSVWEVPSTVDLSAICNYPNIVAKLRGPQHACHINVGGGINNARRVACVVDRSVRALGVTCAPMGRGTSAGIAIKKTKQIAVSWIFLSRLHIAPCARTVLFA